MQRKAVEFHLHLPVSIDVKTGKLLSLAEFRRHPAAAADLGALSNEQKIAILRARWEAGEWEDVIYGTEGLVDLARAVDELERQTKLGRHLMALGIKTIETVHQVVPADTD